MSKERKFHELIEQQNREEKNRVWAKIQQQDVEEFGAQKSSLVSKILSAPWKKWGAIAVSSFVILMIGVFAFGKMLPWGNDSASSGRYFDSLSYKLVDTMNTIKDYAEQMNENILYFDWYAETDYCKNQEWKLKDTGEIICIQEDIVDINTGCVIYIFVMESDVQLDAFFEDEKSKDGVQIDNILINWHAGEDKAMANFVYGDYKYYLRVEEPIDENYILDLIEELLP